MKRAIAVCCVAIGLAVSSSATVVDFDTDGNWTAGSGTITSYQTDHVYADSGWTFTGGPALRQTTAVQDGFAGALGTYSWRLRNTTSTSWTATYGAADTFSAFGFDVRRWDGSPSPAFDVSYSVNGGGSWTSVGTIDNAYLGDSSDWKTFGHTFGSPQTVTANQFVVRLQSSSTTERIMVDDFSSTVIPEPATLALIGLGGLLALVRRWRA